MSNLDDIRKLLDQGLSYYGLGKVSEALEVWNRVLEIDPDNAKAKEYLNFVQQNWGPPPRDAKPEPYRPDEGSDGSGQIQAPPLPETDQPVPKVVPPEETGAGVEFSAPVKPLVESAGWGDLYDFGAVGKGWDSPALASPPEFPPAPAPESPAPESDPPLFSAPFPDPAPPAEPPAFETLTWAPPPEPILPQPEPAPPDSAARFGDSDGAALDLVAEALPGMPELIPDSAAGEPSGGSEVEAWLRGAKDLLELDDFSGALELLDKVLDRQPAQAEVQQLHGQAENQLLSMLSSKLGDLSQIPRVQMPEDEIIWLNYDHRAGFVLSLVDGELSYDEIISISGLSQLESMRFLVQFLLEKVIKVG